MARQDGQKAACNARAIAEMLFPETLRVPEWSNRWDNLQELLAEQLSDEELAGASANDPRKTGDLVSDVLATCCLIRGVDV